jgi:hypothetical protein
MRTLLPYLSACLVGCGGFTFVGITDDGGHDASQAADGGSEGAAPDGSPGGACPADAPTQASPCARTDLWCEYGGTGPELLCSTMASCQPNAAGSLRWSVTVPGKECIASPAQNSPECPATFVSPARACPPGNPLGRCVYAEGMCGCVPCAGDGGLPSQQWACEAYPQPGGCPMPRPRAGSACTQEGQSCEYGSPCGVAGGIPYLVCKGGRWALQPFGADCAILACR